MNGAVDRFFVDTNVLLYALDPLEAAKHTRAREWMAVLWQSRRGRLSWQVIHEFYSVAIGKLKRPAAQVRAAAEDFAQWDPTGFSLAVLQRAWHWADHGGASFWDSLILASAERAGCAYLLSEDFQSGRKYGSILVVNPFQHAPEEFLS
jgi:predicted nucleic acid-binding protein